MYAVRCATGMTVQTYPAGASMRFIRNDSEGNGRAQEAFACASAD